MSASSPEMQRFYDQELVFGPCPEYATTAADEQLFANPALECARLEVPLDYAEPDGSTAQIALLRGPARGEKIGSLVSYPGGPGPCGMNFAALAASGFPDTPVTERFDLIGFDARGIGASSPTLSCFTDTELDTEQANVRLDPFLAGVAQTEAMSQQLYQQCADRSGGRDVLANVGTRDVVRDMDVMRAALGDEQLTYFGFSYGTRIGAAYAAAFPDNVRAMVLDGAVDPDLDTVEFQVAQFVAFQQSFDQLAAACATRPDCALGTDPARATTTFREIVGPLVDRPVPAGPDRQLSYDNAILAVLQGLYDEAFWPAIDSGLAEVVAGRGETLLALADLFNRRGADGRYSNFHDAYRAINCMDERRLTPEQATDMHLRFADAAPFFFGLGGADRPVVGVRDMCEAWPEPTLDLPGSEQLQGLTEQGLPNTLTVSVTGDPATPHQGGINLAEALDGSMLTVEGRQHGAAIVAGNACVDDVVAAYLVDPMTPLDEARCTL